MRIAIPCLSALALIVTACSASTSDGTPGAKTRPDAASPPDSGGEGAAGGGSGDGGGVAPPPVAAARACADLAAALCSKLERCSAFALGVASGDTAKCQERFVVGCVPSFTAPGTSATPTKTAACALAVGGVSCDDVLALNLGPACNATPGTLANGASCNEDSQCATAFCAHAPSAACGTCSAPTTAGAACVNESCSRGTVCPRGGARCITPTRGKVGDACSVQEECDLANAVGCNTNSKKCIALTLATAGGACGLSGATFGVCPASGACSSAIGGRCSAAAATGAACSDTDTGPHCLAPARCVGGTCKITDPTTCR